MENIVEEKEREFVVLYNAGGGNMHEVILDYNETQMVGWFLQDLMKKRNKELQADSKVVCRINIRKDKTLISKKEEKDEKTKRSNNSSF